MKCLSQALDNLNATYENIILMRDFNVEQNQTCQTYIQPQKSCQSKKLVTRIQRNLALIKFLQSVSGYFKTPPYLEQDSLIFAK